MQLPNNNSDNNFPNHYHQNESNTAHQYDRYYMGKDDSIYNKRFGTNKVIPREYFVIYNSFKRIYHRLFTLQPKIFTKSIRILDFGCGNGRLFSSIYRIAKQYINVSIELIAYDISLVGLKDFIEIIEYEGFILDKGRIDENKKNILGYWNKNNLTIQVIHGNSEENLSNINTLIEKPINLALSIFTVLGHIPKRQNRQNLLKDIGKMLSSEGEFIINVSTKISLLEESIAYDILRKQYKLFLKYGSIEMAEKLSAVLKLATEPGDLYFAKYDQYNFIYTYGHVYSKNELIEDIINADLKIVDNVKVMSVEQPYIISKNKTKKYLDTLLSLFLSMNLPFGLFKKSDKVLSISIAAII
ncbi:hypothetical protein NOVO_07775 [Rickettsiales bacterium Ac37b]|nr:hypothetical protein NOVO_07775 [Rickettsiales bacterium Ac37b]